MGRRHLFCVFVRWWHKNDNFFTCHCELDCRRPSSNPFSNFTRFSNTFFSPIYHLIDGTFKTVISPAKAMYAWTLYIRRWHSELNKGNQSHCFECIKYHQAEIDVDTQHIHSVHSLKLCSDKRISYCSITFRRTETIRMKNLKFLWLSWNDFEWITNAKRMWQF